MTINNFTPYDIFCANLVLSVINFALIVSFLIFVFIVRIGGN